MDTEIKKEILRVENGQVQKVEDTIVTEYAVTVKVNQQEFVTMVCTPEYVKDMVIGYLASEKVITHFDDIENIWFQEKEGVVHAQTHLRISYKISAILHPAVE